MEFQQFEILEHNKEGHLDLESEVQQQKNGLFTFIVRVAENKIVDIVYLSYESFRDFEEPHFSPDGGKRDL